MIESEVIKFFNWMLKNVAEEIDFFKSFVDESELNCIKKRKYFIETAISTFKEIKQYQEIGTVDDFMKYTDVLGKVTDLNGFLKLIDDWNTFKELSSVAIVGEACKKYTPKEPYSYITNQGVIKYSCPTCHDEKNRREKILKKGQKYCSECGQAIEWRKNN